MTTTVSHYTQICANFSYYRLQIYLHKSSTLSKVIRVIYPSDEIFPIGRHLRYTRNLLLHRAHLKFDLERSMLDVHLLFVRLLKTCLAYKVLIFTARLRYLPCSSNIRPFPVIIRKNGLSLSSGNSGNCKRIRLKDRILPQNR